MFTINISELDGYIGADEDLYCGIAWQKDITSFQDDAECEVTEIILEPECYTYWHSYTGYRVIMITGGEGFYEEKGLAVQRVNMGDVIKVKPGTWHRHSAAEKSALIHTAITFKGSGLATIWNDIETNNFATGL